MSLQMAKLRDRVALVTGAGRGIGREIALALVREGAHVAVNYAHSAEGAQATVEEARALGVQAIPVRADVTDAASVEAMIARAKDAFGRLDILVNNAGAAIGPAPVVQMAEEAWRRTLEINATGTFLCCKAAAPLMIAGGQGGRIINVSSLAAERPKPFVSAYAASKAAVVALTRSLAQEVAEFGITVNAILPGDVDTALKQWGLQLEATVNAQSYDQVLAAAVAKVPLGRFAVPGDVASLVAFLASDEASFITGQAYNLTGGRELS